MSLIRSYTLRCDICGEERELGTDKTKTNMWAHELPVYGKKDIHYEHLDVCPKCLAGLALHSFETEHGTMYRREDACW